MKKTPPKRKDWKRGNDGAGGGGGDDHAGGGLAASPCLHMHEVHACMK